VLFLLMLVVLFIIFLYIKCNVYIMTDVDVCTVLYKLVSVCVFSVFSDISVLERFQ